MAEEMTEQEQIRELASQFATSELQPNAERWDHDASLDAAAFDQLAELGFFGMLVPEAFDGLDFDRASYLGVLEELSRGEASIGLTLSIHSAFPVTLLVRHGTTEQKERWLPALAAGERIGCFALSEEDAGSDAAAVSARAARAGDGWVLHGTKKWVTNGRVPGRAGLAVVIARTDDGEADETHSGAGGSHRSAGLSAFLVPTDAEGWVVEDRENTMGLRPVEVNTVRLEGLELPGEALLGEEGAGFKLAMEGLDLGRLGIAAQATGIARAALDHAIGYADERQQFGRPIRSFEAIQFKLADMATRVAAASALLDRAAQRDTTDAAAMAKLFCSEAAMAVSNEAVQIFGGYGYMRDYPVEKLMRDAKATEIYEGTNEIQRVIIARELYD